MRRMTRRERRTERLRHYLMKMATPWASPNYQASGESGTLGEADCEAPLPGWLRHLDYKTSSESGALRVPSKTRNWHLANPLERAGTTYVIGIGDLQLTKPINHYRWRRLTEEQMAYSTTA